MELNSDGGGGGEVGILLGINNNNDDDEEDYESQQEFHNTVRENIIFLLFFLTLTVISSWVIKWMSSSSSSSSPSPEEGLIIKRGLLIRIIDNKPTNNGVKQRKQLQRNNKENHHHHHHHQQEESSSDHRNGSSSSSTTTGAADDESVVKRICSWVCNLTLSISIGATLLLPISIVSNEVLLIYPTNKHLEWLNGMLIQGLWNLVFLFSNIGLFVMLPFAHLFIEAEGFSGNKRGLISKLQETVVVLTLLTFTVWGIAVIVNSFVLTRGSSMLFHFNQLPFIYSCISFSGVLVLTLCTPLGLSRLFTVLSDNFVFVPEFLRNLENEHVVAVLEHENLKNKKQQIIEKQKKEVGNNSGGGGDGYNKGRVFERRQQQNNSVGKEVELKKLDAEIEKYQNTITNLESLRTTPSWKRNLLYPGLFISVLFVTGLTVFIVVINAIKIVAGFRDLSLEVVAKETLPLGRSSLSFLGPSGAIFEIILVMYLITTCLIGLYNLPLFKLITPVHSATPTSHLIFNSAIFLVLSSALPVFMRILGLTNFDLLGTYAGKIDWIENTLIVVFVNLLFSVLTCVCLINTVTRKISREIIRRFRLVMFFYKD